MSKMNGKGNGLSPEFDENPYEKLDDLLFDSELEYIVSVEDDYLKQALAMFLNENNLQQKTKDFKSFEYMFISLDLGTFNFIERPNYKDKRVYELPYDWSELMGELKDYISENPFEKHEIADKNEESWATPREDTPGTNHSNDSKSFLERAKAKVLGNGDQDRKNKVDALLETMEDLSENNVEYLNISNALEPTSLFKELDNKSIKYTHDLKSNYIEVFVSSKDDFDFVKETATDFKIFEANELKKGDVSEIKEEISEYGSPQDKLGIKMV